jgi:ATP-binding cassette subfamily B protein
MTTITTISSEFTPPVEYKSNRKNAVRWIISHALNQWPLIISQLFGAFGNAALAAVVPIFIGRAINIVKTPDPNLNTLLLISIGIAGSQILRGLLQFGRNFSAELIGQRVERDIRDELYISLLSKSMTFHSLQPVGDTMARATNDVREVNFLFSPGVNLVIGSANFLIMPLVIAPTYAPILILTPLLFIIGYILAIWQYLRELDPITKNVRSSFGKMNTRLAEVIDGIETVKGMAQEENEEKKFKVDAKLFRDAYVKQGDVEARFLPLLLLAFAEAAGLLQAIILYNQGVLDLGQVVGYFGLLQLFSFPTFVSLFAYSQVSLGIASANRILELINRQNDLDQNITGYQATIHGDIEFNHVTFAYNDQEPVLSDLNFKIKAGMTVAIVGQTGSGKTTLAKLVNRTYDATEGVVSIDEIDVRDWNLDALRHQISIIEQDIFLFSRTVAENIAFGCQDATPEEIEQAAKSAQAHDFIMKFHDGYQTVIGERGVTLSGGQRQRLALARAFLTDPSILILDDSTSAIDSETEDKIQRAIFTAAKGRTTLIITHRLSQIRWADMILVLHKGKISAIGTHDELLKTSEAYRRIFSE